MSATTMIGRGRIKLVGPGLSIIAFLALCLVYLPGSLSFGYLGGFVDDSYILLRYAEHLGDGHGLVWNLGEAPAEGLSSIAWAALLAAIHRLTGLSLPIAALYAGMAFGVLGILTVWSIARRTLDNSDRRFAYLAPLLLATTPVFARHAISGMETTLVAFVYCAIVRAGIAPQLHGKLRIATFGGLAGLLYLVRPEAPLFGFVVPIACYALARQDGSAGLARTAIWDNRRRIFLFVSAFVPVTAVLFAARWAYFGSFLPLPAYMKLGLSHGLASQANFIVSQWTLFLSYAAYLIAPVVLWLAGRPKLTAHQVAIALGVVVFAVYMLQVIPVMNFSLRYFTPMLGPLAVLASYAILFLARRLALQASAQAVMIGAYLCLCMLVCLGDMNAVKRDRDERPNDVAIAQALSSVGGPITLAFSEAGVIPYYSKQRFIDCAGLNDKFIAQNRYRPGFEKRYWPYVQDRYGLPDVQIEVLPECRSYADIALLPADQQDKFEELPDVCGRRLYLLKTSPHYAAIKARLRSLKCPLA